MMVLNKKTNGFLVVDIGERILSNEEAYVVNTTDSEIGPCGRSVFSIERAPDEDDEFSDEFVHYG